MAEALPPLATHEDVAALTGETYDAAQQARLALILAGLSSAVRAECGWHLYPVLTDVEVVVDGSGATVQTLPTMHLRDVTAVEEDGTAVDLARVEWTANGYLKRAHPWTRRLRGVRAVITHGFDELGDVKALVVEAAAARAWTLSRPGFGAIKQIATGPFSARWDAPAALDDDQRATLAPYRLGG